LTGASWPVFSFLIAYVVIAGRFPHGMSFVLW